MKIFDTMKAKAALAAVATQEGISLAEVEKSIQAAIDAAWDDPTAKEEQLRIFPAGKPTINEIVNVLSAKLKHCS